MGYYFFIGKSGRAAPIPSVPVIGDAEYYGTLTAANTHFANRLHSEVWFNTAPVDQREALYQATYIIDNLAYKGTKSPVYLLRQASTTNRAEVIAADATQAREFPRGADTVVPLKVELACYEIAFALLEGLGDALEDPGVQSQGFGPVRTVYDRSRTPSHIIDGVPSVPGWKLLSPYFIDRRLVGKHRIT